MPELERTLRHDTMHVREFRYLRMNGGAQEWESQPKDETVWHINFPDTALKFRCWKSNGSEIVLQETVNPDSTMTIKFKNGANIVILGNMLYYWEMELDKPAGTSYPA